MTNDGTKVPTSNPIHRFAGFYICRDSEPSNGNLQESGGTDGHSKHPEEPLETLIAPVTNPRPLPYRPLPNLHFAGDFASTYAAARQRSWVRFG